MSFRVDLSGKVARLSLTTVNETSAGTYIWRSSGHGSHARTPRNRSSYHPSLRSEKPPVPKNMRGTLTSNNSKSVHTLVFTITLYKLYAAAIPRYLEPYVTHRRLRAGVTI